MNVAEFLAGLCIGGPVGSLITYFVQRIVEKKSKHELLDRAEKALSLMKDAKSLGVNVADVLRQAGVDISEDSTEKELREALRQESIVGRYLLFNLLNRSATYTSIMDYMAKAWHGDQINKAVEIAKRSYCDLWEGMAEKEENEGWIKEVMRSVEMSPKQEEAKFAHLKAFYLYCKNPSEETYSKVQEAMERLSDLRED